MVDSRRLVRAMAFGLVVFVVAGGGVGFALAAGEDSQVLAVPAPRPGDKVVYEAQRVLLDEDLAIGGTGDIQLERIVYQWLPEEWVVDERFADRLARPMLAQYHYRSGFTIDRTVYYDAADGRAIFQKYGNQGSKTEGVFLSEDLPVVGQAGLADRSEVAWENTEYHYTRTPCGTVTPLQGTTYDGGDLVLPGRCGWEDDHRMLFHGEGWVQVAGRDLYHFTAVDDPRVAMLFGNDSPFPVRLVTSSGEITDPAWAVGRLFRLDAVSFTRGGGAYTAVDPATLPPAAGPIPTAPATPWMLDDAGMEAFVDLPLRDAYAAALADTSAPLGQMDLADWLEAHPDGYLAAAWALEYHDDDGQTMPQWIMLWVDDASWLGKRVSWEAAAQGLLLPASAGRQAVVSDWTPSWLPDDVDAFFPDRADLPAAFPVPAAMQDEYARTFGADAVLNRYGFQVFCRDEACVEPVTLVEVGYVSDHVSASQQTPVGTGLGAPSPTESRLAVVDKLMVGANGTAEYQTRYIEAVQPVLPLDGDAGAMDAGGTASGPGEGPLWVAPTAPAAATGVGLVGLLAAALYYFWPSLKGLPLAGLFSRIRGDQVLEHPQRARLLDAVQADPGVHFQELSRRLGLGHGVLEHHLRKLVDAELVVVRRSAGYTCYFPKATDRRVMDAAPMLRSGGSRAVLAAVAQRPGTSSRDLAAHLGLAPSTVSYHLKRLETAGLVLPDARAGVRLTPLGEQARAAA